MTHWAFQYLTKEYTDGTDGRSVDGPDTFNCWGLVRDACRRGWDIELPLIDIGTTIDQTEAIKRAVAYGWRHVPDKRPRERDIVRMTGPFGPHIGLVLELPDGPHVLHAVEAINITLTPFGELGALGFWNISLWRQG